MKNFKCAAYWLIFALVFSICVALFITRTQDISQSRYHLGHDEAFVLGPAQQAVDNGYRGFTCAGEWQGQCYGGLSVLIDSWIIRLLPRRVHEQNATLRPPGAKWFWLADHPNDPFALRFFRLFVTFMIVPLVCLVFRRLGVLSLLVGLILVASPISLSAWNGLKNDYLVLPLLLLSFAALRRYLLRPVGRTGSIAILSLTLIIGFSVRPVGVPWIAGFYLLTVLDNFIQRRSGETLRPLLKTLLKEALVFWGVFIACYLVFNPFVLNSSYQAKWLRAFMVASRARFGGSILSGILQELWIAKEAWALVLLLGYFVVKGPRKDRLAGYYWMNLAILVGCLLLITKRLNNILPYYLPIPLLAGWLLLSYVQDHPGLFTAAKLARVKIFLGVIALMNLVSFTGTFSRHLQTQRGEPTAFPSNLKTEQVYFDRNLQFGTPDEIKSRHRIRFFDSLTDTPQEFMRAARAEALATATVFVPCWRMVEKHPQYFAAEAWARLAQTRCTEWVDVDERPVHSFIHAFRARHFFEMTLAELGEFAAKDRSPQFPLVEKTLTVIPRLMEGGVSGISSWNYAIYDLYRSAELNDDFESRTGMESVVLAVVSNCRDGGSFTVKITDAASPAAPQVFEGSLATREKLCAFYPASICRWDPFVHYVDRLLPVANITARFRKPAHRINIQMSFSDLERHACRVAFEDFRITTIGDRGQ